MLCFPALSKAYPFCLLFPSHTSDCPSSSLTLQSLLPRSIQRTEARSVIFAPAYQLQPGAHVSCKRTDRVSHLHAAQTAPRWARSTPLLSSFAKLLAHERLQIRMHAVTPG
ncbi:hypothetical protein IE81DRAFT_64250 [Ceraceosorus guamensis]|uniref:Uncharacterized protein n=1 Tax=Ceraceosorus guamensis TaxID=1522189 RepID=A0A316VMU5_9BASI|nr:hypothetical protein IE81DRAFT_64250 [Ceraceosorus guamensis]PWN38902.1 hypothetical protein IE81DRAFT_64250 [Ceraceosorus guamensis]